MIFKFLLLFLVPFVTLAQTDLNTYVNTNSQYYKRLQEQKQFAKSIEKLQLLCPKLQCQCQIQVQPIYQNQRFYISPAPTKHFQVLNHRAFELVQAWGDTILESDYVVSGDIRMDSIHAIYYQNNLIAYKIIYSMKSYSLTRCPQARQSVSNCAAGRIYEGSFISADFDHAVIDKNQVAKYYNN